MTTQVLIGPGYCKELAPDEEAKGQAVLAAEGGKVDLSFMIVAGEFEVKDAEGELLLYAVKETAQGKPYELPKTPLARFPLSRRTYGVGDQLTVHDVNRPKVDSHIVLFNESDSTLPAEWVVTAD